MTIQEQIAELRRLHAAATPGNWKVTRTKAGRWQVSNGLVQVCLLWATSANPPEALGAYIAAAHNALPAILNHLEAVEAITAERDQLRAERDAANAHAADLRRALEVARLKFDWIRQNVAPPSSDGGLGSAWRVAVEAHNDASTALARPSAQSLAAIEAARGQQ